MPELIAILHSFVGLAAVLVGWNSYLDVEASASAQTDSPARCWASTTPRCSSACSSARSRSPARSWPTSSCPAQISSSPLMLPGRHVLNLGALVAFAVLTVVFVIAPEHRPAGRDDRHRAAARLAPGRLDRRRRHAGRGVDAQQLLRLGRGRVGLPAQQQPADHHRRPGRLVRCLPVLHHVQGDEPVVHLGHRRRLRRRGRVVRATTTTTASTARSPPTTPPSCCSTPPR